MAANEALWASMRFADMTPAGVDSLARSCGWRVKWKRGEPFVAPEECFSGAPAAPLLSADRLVFAENADDPSVYAYIAKQLAFGDSFGSSPELRAHAVAETKRLAALGDDAASWKAFVIQATTCPDDQLVDLLRVTFSQAILPRLPGASLWLVSINPLLEARRAAVRVLFGAEHVPEVLRQTEASFQGIQTARALRLELHIQNFLNSFFLSASPWSLGLAVERFGADLVVLFGQPQGGGPRPPSLMELYETSYASALSHEILDAPSLEWTAVEEAFRWWVGAVGRAFSVALDPTRFCAADDAYRPEQHFGALLSLERLVGCVSTMLVNYRRDEFARRMLMYDALDLLSDGLKMGEYERLANRTKMERDLTELEQALPNGAAALLLPRARRAVDGLARMEDEFFRRELVSNGEIRLPHRAQGQAEASKPLPLAVAQYIHALRDSNHGFRKAFENRPDRLALFAAHTGVVPDVVSDVPWLHLLRVLADPNRTLNGLGLRPRSLP